jgi:hypothetical protein
MKARKPATVLEELRQNGGVFLTLGGIAITASTFAVMRAHSGTQHLCPLFPYRDHRIFGLILADGVVKIEKAFHCRVLPSRVGFEVDEAVARFNATASLVQMNTPTNKQRMRSRGFIIGVHKL